VGKILAHGALQIPPQDRDDLAQEVMTEVWQAVNRSRFDFSSGFWGFVEVVTARRCIDWLRSRKEQLPIPDGLGSPAPGPLTRALDRERSEMASEVLAALHPRCQQLVSLRLRDELSYKEIAEVTGTSEGTVRVQFYRCIRGARGLLKRIARPRSPVRAGQDRIAHEAP
jgi:RNA polymerase sigma-70 factor, ECF subfamily